MTPEGKVKDTVKKVLKKHNVYYEMPVPTGFGKSGLDFSCCVRGLAFYIETKRLGQKPTDRQGATIENMRKAGAKVFVIDGDVSELTTWLSKGEQS